MGLGVYTKTGGWLYFHSVYKGHHLLHYQPEHHLPHQSQAIRLWWKITELVQGIDGASITA
ncbi:hypothetical protein MKW92_044140 [Papaver armeniacum]|nr:hypothetical protein MKW92_044140 [Papaver armeniacum]